MRSLAREAVFKFLFSQLFNPDDEGLFTVLCKDLENNDKEFASELLTAVNNGKEKFLSEIERLSVGYRLNRLYNVDKCALMLGMAELDNYKNTPVAVVINETVNIVSKYSTENSTSFVNGILAEYSRGNRNGKNN